MTDFSTKKSTRIILRRSFLGFAVLAVVLALVELFYFRADFNKDRHIALEVRINESSDLKTWNTADIGSDQLKYGQTGTLYFHPKSLSDAVIYGLYSKHETGNLLNYLFMFCVSVYLFIISLTIPEKEIFNERTYIKFLGLFFLTLFLKIGGEYFLSAIDNKFYQETGQLFNFYTQTNSTLGMYVWNFAFIIFNVLFGRAIIVQKEQDLTI